jgi:predicted HAD superfamily phosphohydrolase YqeG
MEMDRCDHRPWAWTFEKAFKKIQWAISTNAKSNIKIIFNTLEVKLIIQARPPSNELTKVQT